MRLLASSLICLSAFACGTPAKNGPQCLGGTPGEVTKLATGVGSSEGIAFLNGKLYISGGQSIREISSDGTARTVAALTPSVGMVAWKGALYVAGRNGGRFCDDSLSGVIYKVSPDGQQSVFATGLGSPNFLTVTPWNTLLVADDCAANKKIWEVTDSGTVSVWNEEVLSANGMVFNTAGDSLFVVSTFINPAPAWRLPVSNHKGSGAIKLHDYDSGDAPDGLAMDNSGAVYVALNTAGKIHKLLPDGTDQEFAEGLEFTASMAFGDGPGFDPCSIYATSLLGNDVFRVVVGTPGLPLRQ